MSGCQENVEVEYLTTKAAAALLGKTVRSIQGHVRRGTLKPDLPAGAPFRENMFTRETLRKWATTYKNRPKSKDEANGTAPAG